MIDPAYLKDNLEAVRTALANRGMDLTRELEEIAALEARRRRLIPELEGLKRQQNASADEFAKAKRMAKDTTQIQEANRQRAVQIKQMGTQLDSIEYQRMSAVTNLPNLPHASVPVGKTSADNVEVRRHGTPRAQFRRRRCSAGA